MFSSINHRQLVFFSNTDDDSRNEGTNLFVTGVSKSITESELRDIFAKYGAVDKCQIMMDPHSHESRGFGFVNMADVAGADKAVESLTGTSVSGRTLSVEKARRKRPRTPTPGKYFGPPKVRRGGRGRFDDRYRDRRDFRGGRFDDRSRYDDPYRRGPPRFEDRDRYYRDRVDRVDRDRYRYDDRDRYPAPREYRDSRDNRENRERGDRYGERRYSRDERLPPRDDRLPPREVREDRPYREDRDRYAGPPPATESYRDREDYH